MSAVHGIVEIAALAVGVAILAVPGVCLWRVLFPEESGVERWAWGTTAGLALAVLTSFYLAHVRLTLFWPVWLVVTAVSLVLARKRCSIPSPKANGAELWLVLLLAIVAVSRFAPTFVRDTPPGWDPSFHLILVRKLLLNDHMVRDWRPFEAAFLTYPVGSHFLVAVLARITRLPLPRVFQLLIPALGVIGTAQIYALTQRVFRRSLISLYAALAYGAWAFAGSAGYYIWGGLPNQLAMTFVVGVLAVMVGSRWSRRSTAVAAVLLAAVFITHHHVLLVAGAIVAGTIAYWLLAGESREKIIGLAIVSLVATALASPYLAPQLSRLAEIRGTGVLRFTEPHSLAFMVVEIGLVLVASGVAGVFFCRREDRKSAAVLLVAAAAMLLLYVACGPLYRAYSLHRWGQEYVAFTPSRFLTDLAVILSVFAGYAVYRMAEHYRVRTGVVLGVGLLVALANIPLWIDAYRPEPDAQRREAYAWIEQHTPTDTIVLTRDEWAPYHTWRRTLLTPLPVSEREAQESPARRAATALSHGQAPDASQVVAVIAPGGVSGQGQTVWKSASGWSVVQVWPGRELSTRTSTH